MGQDLNTIEVGMSGPELRRRVERSDFIRYAEASGDFNPLHVDDEAARAAGYPRVFGHGMLAMGILAEAISEWVGPETVRRVSVRFRELMWPDQEVRTRMVVDTVESDGVARLVRVSIALVDEKGRAVVEGEAELG